MAGTIRYVTWSGGPSGDYTCDGTADQVEINSALSWANSNPGNIIMMRGSGNASSPHVYNITGQIFVGSNTRWTAETGVKLFIPNGACGSSFSTCVFPNGTPVIDQLGAYVTNLEIDSFEIDGNLQNQSNKLGKVRDTLRSSGSGVERLIVLQGGSGSYTKASNIYIHNMNFHDAFGEAVWVGYATNVRIRNNFMSNHQHDCIYFTEVQGSDNDISGNEMWGITDSTVRLDNCQNIPVYNNHFYSYNGPNRNGATAFGHNHMQIANNAGTNRTLHTNNIEIYNNYFDGQTLCWIWFNDTFSGARAVGSTPQNVHVHHNLVENGCGWASWASWAGGINVQSWGNGITIEYNTFSGVYVGAIRINSVIASSATHKMVVRNNNIINTLKARSVLGAPSQSTTGYGIFNNVPTKMTVSAENNYMSGNASGDYYGVTPASRATEGIDEAVPNGGTGTDEPDDPYKPTPSIPSIYIPAAAQILDTEFPYVERDPEDYNAYINGVNIGQVSFRPAGKKVLGSSHSPSVPGTNLNDLGLKGIELTIDGLAPTVDEYYKIMAAISKQGRSFLELGGAHKGYFVSGSAEAHSSEESISSRDVAGEWLSFSFDFKCEYPYIESMKKRVRDHYIFGSSIISADDIHGGNIVKNPIFKTWSVPQKLIWEGVTEPTGNDLRNIKYSPELKMWMAVSRDGATNKCVVSGKPIVEDISGNGNHGLAANDWDSLEDGGLTFEGTNGFVSLPDPGISNSANFSIYSVFRITRLNTLQCVYGIGSDENNIPIVNISVNVDNKVVFQHRDDAGTVVTVVSAENVDDMLPHEVIGVKDGTNYILYVDGIQAGTGTATIGICTTTRAAIANLPRISNRYPFAGDIYHTRIFSDSIAPGGVATAATRTTNLIGVYKDATATTPGEFWIVPPWFNTLPNAGNNWNGLGWSSENQMWVLSSITGGTDRVVTSPNGAEFTVRTTPATDSAWTNVLCIPANDDLPNGRILFYAQTGTAARTMYSDDGCATFTQVSSPADVQNNNWVTSAYSELLNTIVVLAYGGSTSKRIMYSIDYGVSYISIASPAQKWTGVVWANLLNLFIGVSEDGDQQIIVSPTGLDGSWTLRDTPAASSTTTVTGGSSIGTTTLQSNEGWNYTTLATSYDDSRNPVYTQTLDARTDGAHYRIDRVSCRLRAVSSGGKALLKVTAESATKAERKIKEWQEASTSYTQQTFDCLFEAAANEAVTIRWYLRSTSASVKAGADNMAVYANIIDAGSSVITYTRNQFRDIAYSEEMSLFVAVSTETAVTSNIMYSRDAYNFYLTPAIANNGWWSVEFSEDSKTWLAVGTAGTKRIMTSSGFGELKNVAPEFWTKINNGFEWSDEWTRGNGQSLKLKGDGIAENPGYMTQQLAIDNLFDAGDMYVLTAWGIAQDLTTGSFTVDIYSNGTIVKELIWNADTEDVVSKEIRFKFDTVPDQVYVRIRGVNTPNVGAEWFCSGIAIVKLDEYDSEDLGSPIATYGEWNSTPNIKLRGVGINTDSGTSNRTIEDSTLDFFQTSVKADRVLKHTVVLPALSGGSRYKLDALKFDFYTNSTNCYVYCIVTIQAASMFGGVETDISMYTTNSTSSTTRNYVLPYDLLSATGEIVTLRWYMKVSNVNYEGYLTNLRWKLTEVISVEATRGVPIYIYNTQDPGSVMQLCNSCPPGAVIQINKDGTGSYTLVQSFLDDSYSDVIYSQSGNVARNAENHSLYMESGSSVIFPMDILYPVSGIPFIKLLVVSGIPQISIAIANTLGEPGTFYSVDSNTSDELELTEIIRTLDANEQLSLRGNTLFYVKIAPQVSHECEFGQMMIYSAMDTLDVRRIQIFRDVNPNSIAVQVADDGKCSNILSLDYRDSNII